jgi:hypothetical protein
MSHIYQKVRDLFALVVDPDKTDWAMIPLPHVRL